jgi:hypothetical protein
MNVGSEVESICGKCGDSWHVVIALEGRRIAKVECLDCGKRHRHRDPAASAAGSAKSAGRRATTARAKSKAAEVVKADPARARRPFLMTQTYQVGDRVDHTSFGEGVVQQIAGPKKVKVLFAVGMKTLVNNRPAS